ELLLAQEALVVFPEATIYYYAPHEVHPLKPGVAWIALDCQRKTPDIPLAIVPIRLVYADRFLRFRSRAEIVVQEPILVSKYADLPQKDAVSALTAEIQRALGDVVHEATEERPTGSRNNPGGGGR